MLLTGSKMIGMPVLSLHVGGAIAKTTHAIIDPENLGVVAYELDGPIIKNDPEVGDILDVKDIRDLSNDGIIVDSADRFTTRDEVIKFDKIMKLHFNLVGLKVVTQSGKKVGKISDYTLDSESMIIYQLIVQRPFVSSLIDPTLTINRSQIIEIDDFKVTIRHDKAQIKIKEDKKKAAEDFVPNFTNPFRKPAYTEDESTASSSTMSE
ncbi:PRC-barrel domain-containing protein [Candidatus Saccharibacteria bacterium]|nr:PRC-barrel domain-containing protein [Candidatus Saccharibacteria bacterium]